jgi:hypothetical protein
MVRLHTGASLAMTPGQDEPAIPALMPHGPGHQFVCYADSCSGLPGARHEATFAAVNAVVRRLQPAPEFVCFPGDAILGLTSDDAALRAQWRYWFEAEMGWLDRRHIPLYLTPGNHDVYDAASAAIWREVMEDLPRHGPPGQEAMSYVVRRGDLALVFVNTVPFTLGGEGRADVAWVEQALQQVAEARYKFVVGHYPVWPVNGYAAPYQRCLGPEDGQALWALLVRHRVLAYLCSHLLAFDVQVHAGVVQLVTAGAGTAHRMPPEIEYLHCVQLAVDAGGLRYQVLDEQGQRREWLRWPLRLPAAYNWLPLVSGGISPAEHGTTSERLVAWDVTGRAADDGRGEPQTLLTSWLPGPGLAPLWIGVEGKEQQLVVQISPQVGRSPHRWAGPRLTPGQPFTHQILLHPGMGPGGVLGRSTDTAPWSTWAGASPWGPERLPQLPHWAMGHGQRGPQDRPFRGQELRMTTWSAPCGVAELSVFHESI